MTESYQPVDERPEERPDEVPSAFAQQSLLPPTSTGEATVDAALGGLDGLAEQPVSDHVATFEQIHAALAESLADLEPNT